MAYFYQSGHLHGKYEISDIPETRIRLDFEFRAEPLANAANGDRLLDQLPDSGGGQIQRIAVAPLLADSEKFIMQFRERHVASRCYYTIDVKARCFHTDSKYSLCFRSGAISNEFHDFANALHFLGPT